jgi:hypothetical protein
MVSNWTVASILVHPVPVAEQPEAAVPGHNFIFFPFLRIRVETGKSFINSPQKSIQIIRIILLDQSTINTQHISKSSL